MKKKIRWQTRGPYDSGEKISGISLFKEAKVIWDEEEFKKMKLPKRLPKQRKKRKIDKR